MDKKNIIIGAGPSGMACGHTLAQSDKTFTIIEKTKTPGGLCKTLNFHGYLFDIGGHRFLSKSDEVNDLWHKIMGDDMLKVNRLSRIYYKKKYFNYPLTVFNTFWNLGPIQTVACILSYLRSKLDRSIKDATFEGWIIKHFGRKLYEIFFKSYTEKVWAMPCENISSDWAIQRIRGLSLKTAIKRALSIGNNRPKTLTKEFLYPRTGPGEFYKRLENYILSDNRNITYNSNVTEILHNNKKVTSIKLWNPLKSETKTVEAGYLFSSMPLPDMIKIMHPKPPKDVIEAADKLLFRNFLVVNVILNKESIFKDQWLYIHSPEVKMGRIQNYKNWSPAMVADTSRTSLGLEYFCSKNDDIWNMDDVSLIDFAMDELEKTGIALRKHLIDGFVIRESNVYPVYTVNYKENLTKIKDYLKGFDNFQPIGRAGLFRYDNSDHAILTGIKAAKNFLGESSNDVWETDPDKAYIE